MAYCFILFLWIWPSCLDLELQTETKSPSCCESDTAKLPKSEARSVWHQANTLSGTLQCPCTSWVPLQSHKGISARPFISHMSVFLNLLKIGSILIPCLLTHVTGHRTIPSLNDVLCCFHASNVSSQCTPNADALTLHAVKSPFVPISFRSKRAQAQKVQQKNKTSSTEKPSLENLDVMT